MNHTSGELCLWLSVISGVYSQLLHYSKAVEPNSIGSSIPCVVEIAKNYFRNRENVLIISTSGSVVAGEVCRLMEPDFAVNLATKDSGIDFVAVIDYIVLEGDDLTDAIEVIDRMRLNPRGRFVILTRNKPKDIEITAGRFWSAGIPDLVFVKPLIDGAVAVLEYGISSEPHRTNATLELRVLDHWKGRFTHGHNPFPNKLTNMNKYPLKVGIIIGVWYRIDMAVTREDGEYKSIGVGSKILSEFAEKLNFKMVLSLGPSGENVTEVEVGDRLFQKDIDLTFGWIHSFYPMVRALDFSEPFRLERCLFAMRMPRRIVSWNSMFQIFTIELWTWLLLALLASLGLAMCVKKLWKMNMIGEYIRAIDVLKVYLGQGVVYPKHAGLRLAYGLWLIYAFLMVATFTGGLLERMSTSRFYRDPETIEEVSNSGLKIITFPEFEETVLETGDPDLLALTDRSLVLLVFILASHVTDVLSGHHHIKLRHERHRRQHGESYLPASFVLDSDDQESGGWGPWSAPSSCSRSCGGGVAFQSRTCHDVDDSTGSSLCSGAAKKFFSCNVQECPGPATDFRAEQCAEFNDVPVEGIKYEWIPYTGGANKCELNCMPRGERFFYRHKLAVTDGTPCTLEQNDVCVQGRCRHVGCDMMLGSDAKEDNCRECGGDGSACNTVRGLLDMDDLVIGYNDILLIPAGATNIAISEVRPSNNYLAIRNSTGHYYLNGNWRIDFPRSLRFAGSVFHYERRPKEFSAADIINALGPITEALYIVLLSQDTNVGVNYEYSIPKRFSQQTKPDGYNWVAGEFSECSVTCGGGIKSRLVRCLRRGDSEDADPELCDPEFEPPGTEACGEDPCPPRWEIGEWGPCSKNCGSGGEQTRDIKCKQLISRNIISTVDDSQCLEYIGPKDIEIQECNEGIECPRWHVDPWKPCDRLCGAGNQTRRVTCFKRIDGRIFIMADSDCPGERPESEMKCDLRPCTGVDWVVSAWSGCDFKCGLTHQTRTVTCMTLDGEMYPDEECNPETKPELIEECSAEEKCAFQWYATQWSECSSKCGAGIQTRRVFCGTSPSGSDCLKQVEDEKCDADKKYNSTQDCTAGDDECGGEWFAGPWSECSQECGGGDKTRKIFCMKDNKVVPDQGNCDQEEFMSPSESCNVKSCGPDDTIPGPGTSDPLKEDPECEDDEDGDLERVDSDFNIVDFQNDDGFDFGASPLVYSSDINALQRSIDEIMMGDQPAVDGSGAEPPVTFDDGSGSGSTPDDMSTDTASTDWISTDTTEPSSSTTEEDSTTSENTMLTSVIVPDTGAPDTKPRSGKLAEEIPPETTDPTDDSPGTARPDFPTIQKITRVYETTVSGSTGTEETTDSGSTETEQTTVSGSTETEETTASGITGTEGTTESGSTGTEGTTESGSTGTDQTTESGSTGTEGTTESGSTGTEGTTESGSTGTEETTESGSTGTKETTESGSTGTEETTESGSTGTEGTTESGSTGTEETTESGSTGTKETTESGSTGTEETTDSGSTGTEGTTESGSTETEETTESGSTGTDQTTESGSTGTEETTESGSTGTEETTESGSTGTDQTTESGSTGTEETTESGSTGTDQTKESGSTGTEETTESGSTGTEGTTESGSTGTEETTESGSTGTDETTESGSTGRQETTESGSTGTGGTTESGSTGTEETTESGSTGTEETTESGSTGTDQTTESGSTGTEETTESGSTGTEETTESGSTGTDQTTESGSTGTEETTESGSTGTEETTESGGTSVSGETEITSESETATQQSHLTDRWTTVSKAIRAEASRPKCRPKKPKKPCKKTKFGCCYDGIKAAKGPFGEGCPHPKTCKETEFGCCPDGVSPATGFANEGCPDSHCVDTLFGCCYDGKTPAEGNDYAGCPLPCGKTEFGCCPDDETPAAGKDYLGCCNVTEHGCCPDGIVPALGPDGKGCITTESSTVPYTSTVAESTTTESDADTESTSDSTSSATSTSTPTSTATSDTSESTTVQEGCEITEFGCCPDNETSATGENFEGCGVIDQDNCTASYYGCCPDEISAALGPDGKGCRMACENSHFGCCDDGSTPAHGPNKEGCCLTSPHKCCPDNVREALGPDFHGCGCQYARYRCCPDNTTTARGPNNEGCGCEHTAHGCCPDRITTASGPDFEGCPCHSYQFGCCPDGVSIARGPQNQGCGCENTEFKCCSDGITPAKGGNYAGCTCDASKFGCCPDGVEEAQGENFEGCLRVPTTPGAACALEKDRGACSNFSVRWFFDTDYGGCSRFWYGGCGGNDNRFKSQEECKDVCIQPKGRDACFLPKNDGGKCGGYNPTWYYDTDRKQCGQFIYTGCLGNANRFKTREDCEELCVEPDDVDPCDQPKEVGPCEGNFARWYFNKETDSCEEFTYGGCKANKNNFATQIACQQQCLPVGRRRVQDVCALEKETGPCPGSLLRWYYDAKRKSCRQFVFGGCKGNGNKFRTYAACEQRCPVRGSCSLPREEGTCTEKQARWSFDQTENRCMPFYYTGCGGNRNNYETEEACATDCPAKIEQETCLLPALLGECHDYTRRWYYDSYDQRCRQFYYGGCGGNGNNFETEQDCTRRCESAVAAVPTPAPPPIVQDFRVEFCSLPAEQGQCRQGSVKWFYDSALGYCRQFRYGGCGGNGNNFNTREECENRCGAVQDVCELPKVVVGCRTAERQYYYDIRSDSCVEFENGGCSGNRNNFRDKESCEARCRKSTDSPTTVTLPTTTTTTIAPITQSPPAKRPLSPICLAPRDPGPCNKDETAYYYDAEKGSCEAFVYGGCEGNANRFRTVEQCERLCGSFQGQDVCNVPVDQGPCRAAFPKFHYDPITRTCQQFIWGGCDGSANRFSSEEECEAVCVHREEPPTGTTSNSAICQEPVDIGSCAPGKYWRYYYNDERLECLAFIYTGCGGNLNRFKSYDACRTTCLMPAINEIDVGPEPKNKCELARAECDAIRCQFGKEQYVDADDCTRCRCVDPCLDKRCPEGTKCAVDRLYRDDVVEPRAVCRPTLKPGNCPKLWNSTTCQKECESDADCSGDFKCCSLGCGSSCLEPAPTEPITTPVPTYDRVPYPGAVAAYVETPEEPNIRAQEGGYVIMKCVARGNPRPVVTWRKGVTLINNSVSRYSVTVEGSLEIIDLYSTDAGTYTCTVDNHVAAPVRIQYELDITAPVQHDPVIIGERDHRVTVSLNSPATLECRAWGWPRPVIEWWHESRLLPVSGVQFQYQRDHSLRINRVSLVDLGVYTCQSFNGIGKPASWSVTLQAPGPVYDVNPAHQQYLQYLIEPQRRPLPPNVRPPPPYIPPPTAPPAPKPRTYAPYDPEDRPPIPPGVIDLSPVIVHNKYTAPVKVDISVEQGPFPAGSNFSIGCNVEGFPVPTVTWYKDDFPIQPDNRIRIHGVNRLVVTDVVKSDAGIYRCEAVNEYSRDDKSVEITVEGIYISPFCQDSPFFANCALIVKGKYCQHDYYAKFCCRSCTEAGQLPGRTPHINDARRKRRSLLTFL